ncbi:MAG: hypothetical protein KGJ13_05725, partial [Patescibacteria group bacterium]|nr:hypothetical protein [Patescibacteria group bacterium]
MTTLKQPTEVFFNFKVDYLLSQKGQRAHLLAGGDGKRQQSVSGQISLAATDKLGIKFYDGRLERDMMDIYTDKWKGPGFALAEYDAPLAFEVALAEILACREKQNAFLAAEAAAKAAAKSAALAACGIGTIVERSRTYNDRIEVKHGGRTFMFDFDPELSALLAAQKRERE